MLTDEFLIDDLKCCDLAFLAAKGSATYLTASFYKNTLKKGVLKLCSKTEKLRNNSSSQENSSSIFWLGLHVNTLAMFSWLFETG